LGEQFTTKLTTIVCVHRGSGGIKCCSGPPFHTRRWSGWREL